ncbi:MAG: sn-glycerol-3-phosphate ABC transporter ATP-binding protein UgpC [Desulfobacteraceae bacterium]|nr:MAG: sn-glycerol-3-phosphate ABC transporter ATP-binding protein UgpC [Desulfobacteraceae bacterium]
MANISLENLTKKFEKIEAVKNISLDVEDGEFLVLVGPSGCGKSTTLRMIAGLEEITSGKIYIGDQVVNNLAPKDRDIAMVFQEYALYPHMSVRKNLAFGLKMRGFPKAETGKRVSETGELLGISDLLDRKPRELSGGQRQRVALGRAIIRKPKAFLFDEPLSNLDAKLRVQMRAELSKLHNRLKTTIIYVTHDQVEAMTMGTKIVIMKDGEIQQIGKPMQIYRHPLNMFVAGFIGSPSMNFFAARFVSKDSQVDIETEFFRVPIPTSMHPEYQEFIGQEVIFGIRPEDIHSVDFTKEYTEDACVRGKVEVIEPLGADILLNISCGEYSFVARVDPRVETDIGEEIKLILNMERMHVFETNPPHPKLRR